jgi:prepilin-type N-terminal cleavage/methylation domain-containing protein
MSNSHSLRRGGFSLLELVIVVVILGILGAIAIPRLSRGSAGAADSALVSNLAVLRNAIDLFSAEHNGDYPTLAKFTSQMLTYSDANGDTADTKDTTHIYGPYLRSIPALPVGTKKGATGVAATTGDGIGWQYDETTGAIKAALGDDEVDSRGVKYNAY